MSATSLAPRRVLTGARPVRRQREAVPERSAIRLAAFTALGLYCVLRWGTLLDPLPTDRVLGLLALALALAATSATRRPRRALKVSLLVVALLAALPLAGMPLTWMLHARVAVMWDAIGQGLSALPRVLVPYNGANQWVHVVILLGAGLLLLATAAALALSPRPLGDMRRGAAALPLIALAVVPSTLAKPHLPVLHGLILFFLLAAFLWGERLSGRNLLGAGVLAVLAASGALLAAPPLERHAPWLNVQGLAGSVSASDTVRFDFTQRYGPLHWPRTGREVLDVVAQRPDYWKAEDLSVFDGRGWVSGTVQQDDPLAGVPQRERLHWTQTLQFTLRAMKSTDLITAGAATQPSRLNGVVLPGTAPGTWTSGSELGPGDSYVVSAYTPRPARTELAAVAPARSGDAMPAAGYRSVLLPPVKIVGSGGTTQLPAQPVVFALFGSGATLEQSPGVSLSEAQAALQASPYARVLALAQQLQRGGSTPYAYLASIERLLSHGYGYDENPPRRQFPLTSFLFSDRRGYCQQFAGSMALLLRMGGIPARVAVGFTTGAYDKSARTYRVSDLDAHAWVEAWFPRYGWVPFDPTPATAPARGGQPAPRPSHVSHSKAPRPPAAKRTKPQPAPSTRNSLPQVKSGGSSWVAPVIVVALLVLLGTVALLLRSREPSVEQLVAELERALRRSGRAAPASTTLASLEQRFRSSPEAAGYVRALRLLRYGAGEGRPSATGRRALRSQLRSGLGVFGVLRTLWALPPRRFGGRH
jgi:protein-glutamine gamma-glutamyltransferase